MALVRGFITFGVGVALITMDPNLKQGPSHGPDSASVSATVGPWLYQRASAGAMARISGWA